MPAVFFGHGSPMNALEHNRYTDTWRAFGRAIPRPRAIVCVYAHLFINASAETTMAQPRTIHDFFGFPDALFAIQYPAPGAPWLVDEIAQAAAPVWIGTDEDSWGLDHGAWSVLTHVFPDADVPVVQLAINAAQPFEYHLDLGRRLAPLREHGVLILGSGNVVHNLGALEPRLETEGFEWAVDFDDEVARIMTADPSELPGVRLHPAFVDAVPTPDHFMPLLYVAGLAAAAGETTDVVVDGYAFGSLSMTSYALGGPALADLSGDGYETIPDPSVVPPSDTNL